MKEASFIGLWKKENQASKFHFIQKCVPFIAHNTSLIMKHEKDNLFNTEKNDSMSEKFLLNTYNTCLHRKYWKESYLELLLIWALTPKNLSSSVCEQQNCRPACASTQSDQHLCYSLIEKYHIKNCSMRNFTILASLCSWAGWFWHDLIRNHEDRFSRV